jgi:AmmeMemoRadiSam system protein B
MRVRRPAVAGVFYPADVRDLAAALDEAFAGSRAAPDPSMQPKALVAPHAGYVYSGPIAASAYRTIEGREAIRRVVLLGPSHFVAFDGLAVSDAEVFATPLGEMVVDGRGRATVAALPQVVVSEVPHTREHSLEVQVPFLQRQLDERVELLPIAVGFAPPSDVAEVLEAVWGGDETLVVVSTDLSHYLDAGTARACDERTAEAVLALDEAAIGDRDACGSRGLRGLLIAAHRLGLRARLLDLRNSGDTAGDVDRVVGYGAFAFA